MLRLEHLDIAPDDFLAHEADDAYFHRAFQAAKVPPGFTIGYYAVYRNDLRVSVVPYFVMDFPFNTMLPEGLLKRSASWLKLRMVSVGHPSSDFGSIHGEISAEVLELVNRELSKKAKLLVYKGFGDQLPLEGFVRVSGLPNAVLSIQGDYWSHLSHSKRKSLKKKLKQGEHLRVEEWDAVSPSQAEQLRALYLNVYEQAATKFECLNVAYFKEMAPLSKYVVFYEGDALIGFVQLSRKKPRMMASYGGMDYERGQHYGLYFLLALKAIEVAVRDGFTYIEFGPSSYAYKKLLGCELNETSVYFYHCNPLIHRMLRMFKFMFEPTAEELK